MEQEQKEAAAVENKVSMTNAQALKTVEVVEDAMDKVWHSLKRPLSPIKNEHDLKRRTQLLDAMLDRIGEDEEHPLAFVCSSLGQLIEEFETEEFPINESSPAATLSFLMEQHGLKQKDLEHILPQSNLSAFLKGKRTLTPAQIVKLGDQFGVSPIVFLPKKDE